MSKFKVGDTVVVTNAASQFFNFMGVVKYVFQDGNCQIILKNGRDLCFIENELESMSPKQTLGYKMKVPVNAEPGWALKCECGSDKANLPTHSTWCMKYKEM